MRTLLILFILFLVSPFLSAQTLSQKEFDAAVDYVTCICVNDAVTRSQDKLDCNSEFTKAQILDVKTRELFDELQSLKGLNDKSEKFLSNEIFTNQKYPKIYEFAYKRKNNGKLEHIQNEITVYFSDLKKDLKSKNQISSDSISEISTPINLNITDGSENQGSSSSNFYDFSFYDLIISFVLILLFIALCYIGYRTSKLEYNSKKTVLKPTSSVLKTQNSLDRIEKLENEIKQLGYQLRDSKNKIPVVEKIKNEETPVEVEFKIPPKPTEEIFFMATPSGEKSFDVSAKTESFKATQSLYKFIVNTANSNSATFIFQSDDTGIRDSVNSPHIYIEPVCDPQNALNQNAKKITTINPGIAEKRNDKWIVTTKAQIKYE